MIFRHRVFIVPTKTMIEGIVALQMDMPDDDTNSRINEFNSNIQLATSIGITNATKNYEKDGFCCKINDKIALIDDKLVAVSSDIIDCLDKAIKAVENLEEKTGMFIYLSKDADDEFESKLTDYVSNLDGLDYQIMKGGQEIYDVLIGIF